MSVLSFIKNQPYRDKKLDKTVSLFFCPSKNEEENSPILTNKTISTQNYFFRKHLRIVIMSFEMELIHLLILIFMLLYYYLKIFDNEVINL